MPFDLAALASRLPRRPLTRFAPSPTGHLHLGHIVNAVYVWGIAAALGGRVLVRIEDHDRERSRPEYEEAIRADLAWLGLEPGEDTGGARMYLRQGERDAVYRRALERLAADGLVYACDCSRRQIETAAGPSDELRYPGTCRDRRLPLDAGHGLRVRVAPGVERFDDARLGPQAQEPSAQCGDVLVRDRVGQWTYQFAVAVDDTDQHVDLVIRGEDLLASTGRQIQLARHLGRERAPVFLHHPLLYGAPGVKLSKSNRDSGIRELRAAGATPAEVLGLAAARCGLRATARPIEPVALAGLFTARLR